MSLARTFVLVLGLVLVLECWVSRDLRGRALRQPGCEHTSGTSHAFQVEHEDEPEHEHEGMRAKFIELPRRY